MKPGVLVLGVPRSGTTVVRRLLDAHPAFACPPETSLFSAAARFLAEHRLDHGVRFGVLSGLEQAGFPREETLGRLRALTFGFLEDHARRVGRPRWAEKTAASVFHLPGIEALCGDEVAYVLVLRHGLDAAVSMKELSDRSGGFLAELHPYVAADARPVVAFAHAWRDATRGMLDLAARRRCHVVRYEDLVTSPRAEIERLFAFLGEDADPDALLAALTPSGLPPVLGFGDWKTWGREGLDPRSVGRWKREVSRDLRSELGPALDPTLEAAGYAPLGEVAPSEPTAATHRFELAMRLAATRKEDP